MKVSELISALNLKIFGGNNGIEQEISGGYSGDLLSDVMGSADEGNVWITMQTHKNVMAVASLKDIAAVVIVKGFIPEEGTILQSQQEGIPLLGTDLEAFEIVGEIYQLLNGK